MGGSLTGRTHHGEGSRHRPSSYYSIPHCRRKHTSQGACPLTIPELPKPTKLRHHGVMLRTGREGTRLGHYEAALVTEEGRQLPASWVVSGAMAVEVKEALTFPVE